jgi:hypothetical protein
VILGWKLENYLKKSYVKCNVQKYVGNLRPIRHHPSERVRESKRKE